MRYTWYIWMLLITFSCSEEKDIDSESVYEIRNIGQLSTSEYTVGKIVKLDKTGEEWYKFGERRILISCKAKIKAGIDLSKLSKDDIKIKGKTIEINLPPAEITSFTMDPKFVHTEMESVSGFRDQFTQQEKNDFLKQGEEAIREDIEQTSILKDAEKNAKTFVEDFYKELGFEKVIVNPDSGL